MIYRQLSKKFRKVFFVKHETCYTYKCNRKFDNLHCSLKLTLKSSLLHPNRPVSFSALIAT